jgi:predicted CXXCH cytochrome family protein
MACHDGVSAGEFDNATPWSRGAGAMGDHRRNHPVGVAYPRNPRGSFRHPAQLPDQVRLPDGKVSCVSCHDLYTQEPDLLSVPIYESKLCMTCHDM